MMSSKGFPNSFLHVHCTFFLLHDHDTRSVRLHTHAASDVCATLRTENLSHGA